MIDRWQWVLRELGKQLWLRAAAFALLGVLASLAAIWAAPLIPEDLSVEIGARAVDDVLTLIASSMLVVATFSLSTMVAAYAAADGSTTPRASRLLIEDGTAQNALSTFIGAFLFALVGIIALSTGVYGDSGRLVLLGVTVVMVGIVVGTFVRWIDRLSRLGRIPEIIDRVEAAAAAAMLERARYPTLGTRDDAPPPAAAIAVGPDRFGYVCHIDVGALDELGTRHDGHVHVATPPGSFAEPGRPLAFLTWEPDDEDRAALRKAFLVEKRRSFEQDPRFGVVVLSEIASRALSPGINDPGTAIDVLGAQVRVLALLVTPAEPEADAPCWQHVHLPRLAPADLFEDAFVPIARDGAGMVEVGIRLQRALRTLGDLDPARFGPLARTHAADALARAAAVVPEIDLARMRAVAPPLA